jgi:Haem-degrading
MTNVMKKYSILSELAQKMVDEAVKKAREIGVSENAAILDDGGNLKAFSRMDGPRSPVGRKRSPRPWRSSLPTRAATSLESNFSLTAGWLKFSGLCGTGNRVAIDLKDLRPASAEAQCL